MGGRRCEIVEILPPASVRGRREFVRPSTSGSMKRNKRPRSMLAKAVYRL